MPKRVSNVSSAIRNVECVWALICSLSVIDRDTNNISLFNVVEQMGVAAGFFQSEEFKKNGFAVLQMEWELVLMLRRLIPTDIDPSAVTVDVKLSMIDPQGKAIQEVLTPVTFPANARRYRFVFKMKGLPIGLPGDYVYRVELRQPGESEFSTVREIPFDVLKIEAMLPSVTAGL